MLDVEKSDLCSLDIDIGPCFTGAWADKVETVWTQYAASTIYIQGQ